MITKKVSIKNIVNVCLIPHRQEYQILFNDLWWSSNDILKFRSDYETSLKLICQIHNVDMKKAKKILDK
jgi:hypothetical protein